ncbi:glycoside hydrolase family 27 protein [Streptomyces reniochalinae]|uniref:Alpha-galactosidase n=1 Tax=Streptomyces reniochalinae TaxID=2250578 RepID=A0A367ESM0_9ACTN|nr:glycoside hydrolase family 27 protein [Streptomyces reniochalinae]
MRPTVSTRTTGKGLISAIGVVMMCGAGLAAPASAATPTAEKTESAQAARESSGGDLTKTPPMGFNNWNATHCGADFNEEMVKDTADIFVEKGLKDAGYEYVNLDDCWAEPERDADGKLVPNKERFPHGIEAVADYVHSKGLKLGIYTSAGTWTCNTEPGMPGALGHEESDARQFADWGVDYLKYDNCNNEGRPAQERYQTMRDALDKTGRDIVYNICEWGENKPWEWAPKLAETWRTTEDISDNWDSMLGIMQENLKLSQYASPGDFNDPDMLEVGNGGMTDTEYRTHFSMWSIMAAPLLIGSDLREDDGAAIDILSNKEVIAVDQDALGKQGEVVSQEDGRWVVSKELADGSRAIALFNETDQEQTITTTADAATVPHADSYKVRDLWKHSDSTSNGGLSEKVPSHGTVMLRVTPEK